MRLACQRGLLWAETQRAARDRAQAATPGTQLRGDTGGGIPPATQTLGHLVPLLL